MKKKRGSRKRILTILLCWALCAADIMPTSMTVWASEQAPESIVSYDNVSEIANEGNRENNDQNDTGSEENTDADTDEENSVPGEDENDVTEEEETPGQEDSDEDVDNDDSDPNGSEDDSEEAGEESDNEEDSDEIVEESEEEIDEAVSRTADLNAAFAGDDIAHGEYEEITWRIDKNGKLTVEGEGDFERTEGKVPNYVALNGKKPKVAPWHEYRKEIRSAEVNVTGMTDASYMFLECTNLTSINLSKFDTGSVVNMSGMFLGCAMLMDLDVSNFKTGNVTDMSAMFSSPLKSGLDLRNFDTSRVTDMSYMFYGSMAKNIDLSSFKTGSVTNMSYMFGECWDLTDLDLSHFDTAQVTDMSYMFQLCYQLTDLDLSHFNTGKVTSMNRMFSGCNRLTDLNISSFDTAQVTDMSCMFDSCYKLTDLDLSHFKTSQVTNVSNMFWNCKNLKELNLSGWDADALEDGYVGGMFDLCNSLETIYAPLHLHASVTLPSSGSGVWRRIDTGDVVTELPQGEAKSVLITKKSIKASGTYTKDGSDTQWVLYTDGKLVVTGTGEVRGTINFTDGTVGYESVPWYDYRTEIKTAEISVQGMKNANSLFRNCSNLVSVDVSKFDTSRVTDMSSMFSLCTKLTKLDLSGWTNDQVTDMSYMFQSCTSLTELNLTDFKTANVTTMKSMFSACHKLTKLDVSSFDTGNVKDMSNMFVCAKLTELDVSGFVTSNVTDMSGMFICDSLKELDVSRFDTRNVENMNRMFYCCQSLTKLDVSNFDTSKVTDMGLMFYFCLDLKELILDVSKFNTGNVTDMSYMFYCCESLQELDVSRFDTHNVENMERMFCECSSLTQLDVSSFDTSNVTNMELMFAYLESLKELDLSGFDTGRVTNVNRMFDSSKKLEVIYAPLHLNASVSAALPKAKSSDAWYRADTGDKVTQLPADLIKSILLTKNKKVVVSDPYISAVKDKTTYAVGDVLNTNDIIVTYYSIGGAITKLTAGFDADKDAIDMSVPGKKELVITYVDPDTKTDDNPAGIKLETTIELTITLELTNANTTIIPTESNIVYSGYQQKPKLDVTVSTGKTSEIKTSLKAGTDYEVTYDNNINVGTATVTITGIGDIYSGTASTTFTINKKMLTVRVKNMNLAEHEEVPDKFDYEVDGIVPVDMPAKAEELPIEVSYSFKNGSGGTVGREDIFKAAAGSVYYVIPSVRFTDASYEANYNVNQTEDGIRGILTITKERVEYKVTFDMMGHGGDIAPITGITAGSLSPEPNAPEAEGYVFDGWYKDKTFAAKQKWNFATDTVQADTTLYACWIEKGTEGYSGLQFSIQDIQDQTYTGSVIKPTVYVYAADGVTLLKSGKDYTIKYANNTNVPVDENGDTAYEGKGGTAMITDFGKAGKEERSAIEGTFDEKLPYVIITGKGNYSGAIYKNFQILPAKISTADDNVAAGFTLKYSDQLVTNTKKTQNPFSSLKYKKAMKLGTDYKVTITAQNDVKCDPSVTLAGESDPSEWFEKTTCDEKTKKYTAPVIPKGYYGTFTMEVEGVGNYGGSFTKDIVVMDKDHLMKNASVSLGKNQKSRAYMDGWEVTLTPGYMVVNGKTKEYYAAGKSEKYANANDIFMVSVKDGKTTKYLRADEGDFTVSYTNNIAVGTATMTVTGNPDRGYYGSKSVTFKITGTAFNTKNVTVNTFDAKKMTMDQSAGYLMPSMEYTGEAITQNGVELTTKDGKTLEYGKHYTISYKNNIKKGKATMTFTAKPESGYSGSFSKTFTIAAADITELIPDGSIIEKKPIGTGETPPEGWKVKEDVAYVKGGVKLSDVEGIDMNKILINEEDIPLTMGTDFTVKYKNNTAVTVSSELAASKMPYMTITGKGNYKGTLTVYFDIKKAQISAEQITVSQTAWNENAKDTYEYKPGVKVVDSVSGKTLSAGTNKDYYISGYKCNTKNEVNTYFTDGDSAGKPTVVITVPESSSYELSEADSYELEDSTMRAIEMPLPIYGTKLTSSNLYIIVSDKPEENTYTGTVGDDNKVSSAKPEVTVYYGEDLAKVKAAKNLKGEEFQAFLEDPNEFGLTELTQKPDGEAGGAGDYTVTYGANNVAGKNKGSVTITGVPKKYGGSVTVMFTINPRTAFYQTQTP